MTSYYERNKEAVKARRKERLQNNPELRARQLATSKKWREENRERFKNLQNEWMKENPNYYYLNNARARAKAQKIPFNLTINDIRNLSIPEFCPYLGIPLEKGGKGGTENSPSLDKIVPSLGYVAGNVEFISSRANRLKNDATLEELQKIAARLEKLLKG